MANKQISIADDFSRYPAGRTRRDGAFSAEKFRDDILVPALHTAHENGGTVTVVLDGVYGYSSSFLEETFGGLVRLRLFDPAWLRKCLIIQARDPIYATIKIDAQQYLADELAAA
jgi:hypothetical protein